MNGNLKFINDKRFYGIQNFKFRNAKLFSYYEMTIFLNTFRNLDLKKLYPYHNVVRSQIGLVNINHRFNNISYLPNNFIIKIIHL